MRDVVTPPVFTVMFMKEFMLFTAVPMKKCLMIIIYGNDDLGDLGDLDDPDDDLVGPTHDLVQYLQAGLAAQGPWESPSADGGGGKLPPPAFWAPKIGLRRISFSKGAQGLRARRQESSDKARRWERQARRPRDFVAGV